MFKKSKVQAEFDCTVSSVSLETQISFFFFVIVRWTARTTSLREKRTAERRYDARLPANDTVAKLKISFLPFEDLAFPHNLLLYHSFCMSNTRYAKDLSVMPVLSSQY